MHELGADRVVAARRGAQQLASRAAATSTMMPPSPPVDGDQARADLEAHGVVAVGGAERAKASASAASSTCMRSGALRSRNQPPIHDSGLSRPSRPGVLGSGDRGLGVDVQARRRAVVVDRLRRRTSSTGSRRAGRSSSSSVARSSPRTARRRRRQRGRRCAAPRRRASRWSSNAATHQHDETRRGMSAQRSAERRGRVVGTRRRAWTGTAAEDSARTSGNRRAEANARQAERAVASRVAPHCHGPRTGASVIRRGAGARSTRCRAARRSRPRPSRSTGRWRAPSPGA